MEPTILASLVLSAAILIAGIIVARSYRRARGERTDSTATGDPAEVRDAIDAIEEIRSTLKRIDRRIGQLESSAARPPETAQDPPLETDLRTAVSPASMANLGDVPAVANEAVLRETKPRPIDEIRRLAQRGRDVVEIAQLVDADIGEVELVLRLDRARGDQR
ncbi:MAG: hypothetical protein SGJ09_11340 [Phycisphaerae bacterium]|nr:hypothetical protein [Phycisphaerae bacterium]